MKRAYYTNPLHAAVMSQDFGMQYVNDLPTGQQHAFQIFGASNGWAPDSPYMMQINRHGERRFYIHPDSLGLLEPMVGDVVLDSDRYPRPVDSIRARIGYVLWADDEAYGYCHKEDCIIIQRGGQPFFSPEWEQ